jgi:hypothetical protein
MEDVIKGKRWFVEIDIAAWLSTNISCRDSTILLIKVDQGTFVEHSGNKMSDIVYML